MSCLQSRLGGDGVENFLEESKRSGGGKVVATSGGRNCLARRPPASSLCSTRLIISEGPLWAPPLWFWPSQTVGCTRQGLLSMVVEVTVLDDEWFVGDV